jgi:DNA-binding CsgD family transcriptional regulator
MGEHVGCGRTRSGRASAGLSFGSDIGSGSRAILAIAGDRRLLYQNSLARALTSRGDWLGVRDGRLWFVDRGVLSRVVAHITPQPYADKTPKLQSTALALRTEVRRDSQSTPVAYRLLVTPLDGRMSGNDGGPGIWLVFVSEIGSEKSIDIQVLAQLYGLTRAESQLAVCLFAGRTLEEAARLLDISINTAKTHLRQVFQKCGVQSQANLLQLLALGPRAF